MGSSYFVAFLFLHQSLAQRQYQHRYQHHITYRAKTNALLNPLTVFSPLSRDELIRAVHDCLGVSSEGNRPTILHGPIGNWDVSQVTDMMDIFYDRDSFNYDLSNWDVPRVTNMQGMFANAQSFNQDLSKWDVSRVTDMSAMFDNAFSFNQDLSKWDVSRVTNMVCACVSIDGVCERVCGGRCACVCDIH